MADIAHGTAPALHRSTARTAATAAAVAAVSSVLLSLVVAAIAHAAGTSSRFQPLTPGPLTFFIVVGVVAGAIGWTVVRARAADPAVLLSRLVPAVFAVSLVPDVLVGVQGSMAGASWGAVAALMVAHLVVTVCAVVSFLYFLPVPRR